MARPLAALLALALLGALPARALPGDGAVQRVEQVFVDASRATPASGAYPGAPERTLRTLIWIPDQAAGATLPLLLLAHGFGGLPEKFDALARFIASRGYVVAAPAFPLSNQHAPGGQSLGDLDRQPGDVAFVLSALLAAGAAAEGPLAGRLDATAIALLGHSLGGLTAQTVAFSPCCADPRVRAAILVGTVSIFDAAPPASGPPTLVLHGIDDPLIPFARVFALLAALPTAEYLVGIPQGSHSALLESQVEPPIPARDAAQRTIVAFLDAMLRGQPAPLGALLSELAAAQYVVVRPPCTGDCDGDGVVFIDELLTGVRIAAGAVPTTACPAFDRDRSESVTIDELLVGLGAALREHCADGAAP